MNCKENNLKKNKKAPDSWCVLPWSHINILTNGHYKICCRSRSVLRHEQKHEKRQPFHIKESSWENVMNSETMKLVRKNMLEGKWSAECVRCQLEHESGMSSLNRIQNYQLAQDIESEHYPNYLKAKELTKSDGSISSEHFFPQFLEMRLGNLCNLKCVMCGPANSSRWYNDHQILTGAEQGTASKDSIDPIQSFNFQQQFEKYQDKFRRIYIAGGEPLIMKEYYRFLQKCIDKGIASKLIVDCNSNITRIPERAWKMWKHFKLIQIGISLDGFGEVNDFIRYPSQWNKVEENLLKLDRQDKNFKLYIEMTVSVLNIWHLPKFIEYIMKCNYKRINQNIAIIHHRPVYSPDHLNINILSNDYKEKIVNRFTSYKKKISNFDWHSVCGHSNAVSWEEKINRACQILDGYIEYMSSIQYDQKDLLKKRDYFIYFMDKLDNIRNTSWSRVLPELYKNTQLWRRHSQV